MYSLLIDSHGKKLNIGIYKDKKSLSVLSKESNNSHSNYIMPTIKKSLENLNLTKNDIKEIIVVNGPGSFTGIRLGIIIAKTWAYTQNISLKAISSLEILACSIKGENKKVAIADAKGFYTAIFDEHNQKKEEYQYTKELNDFLLEDEIEIDYNAVYAYVEKLDCVNPHTIKPIYIKKIGVENDSASQKK